MTSVQLWVKSLAIGTMMVLACAGSAHAYIDPGTGSMILQALAGAVIAVGLVWRQLVARVKGFFSNRRK